MNWMWSSASSGTTKHLPSSLRVSASIPLPFVPLPFGRAFSCDWRAFGSAAFGEWEGRRSPSTLQHDKQTSRDKKSSKALASIWKQWHKTKPIWNFKQAGGVKLSDMHYQRARICTLGPRAKCEPGHIDEVKDIATTKQVSSRRASVFRLNPLEKLKARHEISPGPSVQII